jgi:hypothetical protein
MVQESNSIQNVASITVFYLPVGIAHIQANVTLTTQVSLLSNDCLLAVAKQRMVPSL